MKTDIRACPDCFKNGLLVLMHTHNKEEHKSEYFCSRCNLHIVEVRRHDRTTEDTDNEGSFWYIKQENIPGDG